jgi:hypothetical protein
MVPVSPESSFFLIFGETLHERSSWKKDKGRTERGLCRRGQLSARVPCVPSSSRSLRSAEQQGPGQLIARYRRLTEAVPAHGTGVATFRPGHPGGPSSRSCWNETGVCTPEHPLALSTLDAS